MFAPRDVSSRLLQAALDLIREQGYAEATLERVSARARVELSITQALFPDRDALFEALLRAHSPLEAMEKALDEVKGESAEDLMRDAMRRLVQATRQHTSFLELAVIDAQVNNGAFLSSLTVRLAPKAVALLNRVKSTGALRPIADPILGRTLAALLIGFLISERAVPQVARFAMRLFPERAWVDGMVDLLLYGILEDDKR